MAVPGIIRGLSRAFRELVNAVKSRFSSIKDAVLGVWEKINSIADAVTDKIEQAVTTIFDHIWGATKHFISRLNMVTGLFPATFRRVWQSIFNNFVKMAKWVKGKVWKAAMDTIDYVFGRLSDLFVSVRMLIQWVQDWGNRLVYMLQHFPEFLAGHLAQAFGRVVDQVGDVLDDWIDRHWED
jgi:phage-related protein